MPRKIHRPLEETVAGSTPIARLQLAQFADRLTEKMLDRGWKQADLARAAFGETVNSRGQTVAAGRDKVSSYIRGRSWPTPQNLQKLADALGCLVTELAPDIHAATIDRRPHELSMFQAPGRPGKAHLQVNKLVPVELAAEIISKLSLIKD